MARAHAHGTTSARRRPKKRKLITEFFADFFVDPRGEGITLSCPGKQKVFCDMSVMQQREQMRIDKIRRNENSVE